MVMHGQELSALQGFEQAQSTGEAKMLGRFLGSVDNQDSKLRLVVIQTRVFMPVFCALSPPRRDTARWHQLR